MPCSVGKGFCMKAIPDICSSILRSNSGAGVGGRLKLGSVEMTWARAWGPQRPWAVGRCSCACLLTGESPTPAWSGGPPPTSSCPTHCSMQTGAQAPRVWAQAATSSQNCNWSSFLVHLPPLSPPNQGSPRGTSQPFDQGAAGQGPRVHLCVGTGEAAALPWCPGRLLPSLPSWAGPLHTQRCSQ